MASRTFMFATIFNRPTAFGSTMDMTSRRHGRRLMQLAGMDPYTIGIGQFGDRPQLDRTVLQWNRGDGTYAEVAHYAGLEDSEWNWSVAFLDVDLDGYEDVRSE